MASDKTVLGDRMKAYEKVTQGVLTRRLPTIIRVDGRAFHTYLKGADRPYDMNVLAAMGSVALYLCQEIQGAVFAYQQSDEISILLQDYEDLSTQPWFGGNVQKVVSISAAMATAQLNAIRTPTQFDYLPVFDSRVFQLPSAIEVANYFLWRQKDAVRNSIHMAARAQFSHAELQNLSSDELQEKMWQEKDINWNDYPASCKRGQIVIRDIFNQWRVFDAPQFTASEYSFLTFHIPAMKADFDEDQRRGRGVDSQAQSQVC